MAAPEPPPPELEWCAIDEMDPSLSGGHRVLYDREVPFEIRVQQSAEETEEAGSLEAVKVKLLLLGDDHSPSALRVELTSEADLFFHYTHEIDPDSFAVLQERQKLMIEFHEYAPVLIRMLNSCIREPHAHLAVLVLQATAAADPGRQGDDGIASDALVLLPRCSQREGLGRLDFIQNMEYKFVELLNCSFTASPEDTVRRSVTFRYNSVKSRLALMQARLQHINALVKLKNPSLLLQLQRAPARSSSSVNRREHPRNAPAGPP